MTNFAGALRPSYLNEAVSISIVNDNGGSVHAFGVVERVQADRENCYVFFRGNGSETPDIAWSLITENLTVRVNLVG